MSSKNLLFIFSRPPFGNTLGAEGLDAVLAAAVFDQNVTLLFQLDGVYQLVSAGDPVHISLKDYRKGFRALEMYGIDHILVDKDSLESRGLSIDRLSLQAEIVGTAAIKQVIAQADAIFTF